MTPQLQAAITAIQPLSQKERQQLLQLLVHDAAPQGNLEILNMQFWQGFTLEQLTAQSSPTAMKDLGDFAVDFWPEDESVEDFLAFLRQQRQEAA